MLVKVFSRKTRVVRLLAFRLLALALKLPALLISLRKSGGDLN